jgi:hypothetical protein
MKNAQVKIAILLVAILFQSCSSIKVLDSWKADQAKLDSFKEQNILVIARTADNQARVAFEEEIAAQMATKGFKVTESFKKFPKMHKQREMTEERMKMVRSIIDSEGYTGVVVTSIKDKEETTTTSTSGIYMGAGYYPGYYGGFYNYYRYPYAAGPYYSGFGGYMPTSTSTYTSTTYVVETVAYNLKESGKDQLVSVVTSSVTDPKEASKVASKYVEKVAEALAGTNPE